MLTVFVIYIAGRHFYNLAEDHGKNKWLYGILGVLAYYAGTFVFGILFLIFVELTADDDLLDTDSLVLSIVALPFGFAVCWGLHKMLQNNWSAEEGFDANIIDEIGQKKNDVLE